MMMYTRASEQILLMLQSSCDLHRTSSKPPVLILEGFWNEQFAKKPAEPVVLSFVLVVRPLGTFPYLEG
jgi:hypothetical protein